MLQAISWQQYLTAVLLASFSWYAYVGFRFYRGDILTYLKLSPKGKNQTIPAVAFSSVMGKAKPDEGSIAFAGDDLVFSSPDTPDEISSETIPRGPADDLLDEAKALVNAFSNNDDKATFLALLHALLDQYELEREEISLTAFRLDLREYASTILPFSLSDQEWALEWPNH